MATSRHAWFPAACAAALMGMSASGAWAEDTELKEVYQYKELRLGYSTIETPRIRQQKPDSAQGTWSNNGNNYGYRVGLTYLSGKAPADSWLGTVWGAQLSISSYDVGDNGVETNLIQPNIDLYYGWQYGIMETQGLRGFGELLPYVGVGSSHMELEDKMRLGGGVEAGVRAGAYLTERSWELGVTTAYQLGYSKMVYSLHNQKRIIEITANGFSFGIEGGYRF
jgi:opacity protein-like surface antigen